jgi:hypothetical protein
VQQQNSGDRRRHAERQFKRRVEFHEIEGFKGRSLIGWNAGCRAVDYSDVELKIQDVIFTIQE